MDLLMGPGVSCFPPDYESEDWKDDWYPDGCDFRFYSAASGVTKFFGANAKLNRGLSIRYNRFRKPALDALYLLRNLVVENIGP